MEQRRWFSVQQLVLACLVGLIVGVGGFLLTAQEPDQRTLGLCHPSIFAGFDLWTGLPHGATMYCPGIFVSTGSNATPSMISTPRTSTAPTPPELATRVAVPVPLGFVVGAGLVLLVPTVRGALKRRSP